MHRRPLAWPRAELLTATSLLLGSIAATLVLARHSAAGLAAGDAGRLPESDLGTLLTILGRNTLAALGLFSGAVTLGLGSVVFLLLIGLMLGLSMGVAVEALGWATTLGRAWAYTPLELAGFALAGAAGLVPVWQRLVPHHRRDPAPLARAFRWFLVALLTIVVAAVVETVAIAHAR